MAAAADMRTGPPGSYISDAGIKESTNQEDRIMKHLTEQQIAAMAPNASAVANAKKIVKSGGFTHLARHMYTPE